MMLVRPLMTNLKTTLRDDCAVSACSPSPTSVYKSSHLPAWAGSGGCSSQPLNRHLPPSPPQLPVSEIKQTFLSSNLACLLTFEQQVAEPTTRLLVTGYTPSPRRARKSLSQNMTQVCTIPVNHRSFHGRTQRPNVNFFCIAPVVPDRH